MPTTWCCLLCEVKPLFDTGTALLDHVAADHGKDREAYAQSSGSLVEALDGRDWYRNTIQYAVDGIPWAVKVVEGKRVPDDPMRG